MRKLLVMLNAMLRHETTWNPAAVGLPLDLPYPFSTARGGAVVTADNVATA